MKLKSKKVLQAVAMNSNDAEPPCILGLERFGDSITMNSLRPASFNNDSHEEKYYFSKETYHPKKPFNKYSSAGNVFAPVTEVPDISMNEEWRVNDMYGNNEAYMQVYNESDEEDNISYGPPILSPQVEIIEDEGLGNSILDYQFEEPGDEMEIVWARPAEQNAGEPKRTASGIKYSRPRKRKNSELASILREPAKRQSFTYVQYEALFATWEVTHCPLEEEVLELVHITGLTVKQVKSWFRNRKRLTRGYGKAADRNEGKKNKQNVADSDVGETKKNVGAPCKPVLPNIDTGSRSSRDTNNGVPLLKLSKQEKRDRRVAAIKQMPVSALEECMENSRARISQLILMYMKRKLDMRRTLLRETTKLKDRIKINPFSESQVNAMKLWRDDFFTEVSEELNEDKKQKLGFVKSSVIEVWHPVVIYGKLTKVSLEVAIDDFSNEAGKEGDNVADTEEFTVPGILRYMESHFK